MSNKATPSLRAKLEDFFNPGPSSSSKNQKKQSFDPEDPVDLYNNHTAKFFKANKKTDSYADQIEIGERRIRPNIADDEDLQKVYGGMKVSRKELQKKVEEVSEDEYGEDESMEGEYDDEESAEQSDDDEHILDDESEIEDDLPADTKKHKGRQQVQDSEGENDEEDNIDMALSQLKRD